MLSGLSLTSSLGSVLVSFSDRLSPYRSKMVISGSKHTGYISFNTSRKGMSSCVSEEFHKSPAVSITGSDVHVASPHHPWVNLTATHMETSGEGSFRGTSGAINGRQGIEVQQAKPNMSTVLTFLRRVLMKIPREAKLNWQDH